MTTTDDRFRMMVYRGAGPAPIAARGVVIGLALSAVLWGLLGVALWR